jgi:hypothetical protein
VGVGIPDEESWFRTSYVPSGRATGWRRAFLIGLLTVVVLALIAGIVVGLVATLS